MGQSQRVENMTVTPFREIKGGGGSTVDRTYDLAAALREVVEQHQAGMTLASVIGCLEVVKLELFQREASDD